MKQTIILVILYSTIVFGAASRGAVTEGLFIIQNKHRDAKEEIQELKKELTACFSNTKEKPLELETYHCKLRKLLYPGYIDELSRVINYADKQVVLLKKDDVEQQALDRQVQRAMLFIDKITLERQLLKGMFAVDRKLKQLSILKKKQDPREKGQIKHSELTALQEAIKKSKQQVTSLQKRIQEINGNLFTGMLTQEVFLDKLAYYTP